MRLKYQLRGLGIGIILTAALLMISSDDGEASIKEADAMSVASAEAEMAASTVEIESISAEVEETIVYEEASIEKISVEETSAEEESSLEDSEMGLKEEETVSELEKETSMEESALATSSQTVEVEELVDDTSDVVKIKIVGGDDSGTVARKLQVAGLVDNASEFDAYLMQHGYDKKIAVGEKEIPTNATWMEIAEKISSR